MTACTPRLDMVIAAETSAQLLQALMLTEAFMIAPRSVQELSKHVLSLLNAIIDPMPPSVLAALGDEMLNRVVASFLYFCVCDDGGVSKYGAETLALIADRLVAPQDVVALSVFRWLLPRDIAEDAHQLIKDVASAASRDVQSTRSTFSRSKSVKKDTDVAVKAALDMVR
eukprot:TRINITY_DN56085_c0_g1_i1.p1 TRINITY_DN56085_c0_g1~~TRINITY_DN56085_c0_g1_i1.p1  ORF type:complete len:170 (-),score=45.30 TRINITY_DN56085_c0_g1_i1:34-543(-)